MSIQAQTATKARPRREKLFGDGRPRAMNREAKLRVTRRVYALMRRTEAGKAYGAITAKASIVLRTLLWQFHNSRSGLCFPSLDTIAERAACARSTVVLALKALEAARIVTWVNRIVRIRVSCGEKGSRIRVLRTSNAYTFTDPATDRRAPQATESENQSGTINQESSLLPAARAPVKIEDPDLAAALDRLARLMGIAT